MKKILFTASVFFHFNAFHIPYLKYFHDLGYEVYIAAKGDEEVPYADVRHVVNFERSPFSKANFAAYRELKTIIEENHFELIHCHTPVASILTRLAARGARKKGTQVVYTAHGFHFYKGAPLVNWLVYYPVEWLCSFFTDCLITINQEDFGRAKKHFHARKICYIPGMGVDCNKIAHEVDKPSNLREKYGIPKEAFVVLSVGEVNQNKNHKVVLDAIHKLSDKNIYYVICGRGNQSGALQALAKRYGMEDQLKLVGFQTNITEWLSIADVFAFPSVREGLGLAALEAMAAGLPLVTSDSGGIKDFMENGKTGFCCHFSDSNGFAVAIRRLKNDLALREQMSRGNREAVKRFDIQNVKQKMEEIYRSVLE